MSKVIYAECDGIHAERIAAKHVASERLEKHPVGTSIIIRSWTLVSKFTKTSRGLVKGRLTEEEFQNA